jgi:adenine-specific DNA-methyltransferase
MEKAILTDKASQIRSGNWCVYNGDVEDLLALLPRKLRFDLVITSPPYNLGKEYEPRQSFNRYLRWQADIMEATAEKLTTSGSICWQVGNYVNNGSIEPLDIHLHNIFRDLGFRLRNRIVWTYGHGLHCQRRFSGRYEVILWYTKSEDYTFNLNSVRIPSKYPLKRGRNGKISSHPDGKNPEDVWVGDDCWAIPNVKSNHVEKTRHPCQFPVGLASRLIKALSRPNDLVFDPFCGVGTTGVAAAIHSRHFIGAEIQKGYARIAKTRIDNALAGTLRYRDPDKPIYDHTKSSLSGRRSKS